ncbi:hypothetical protein BH23BAC4_BH23BAC4_10620 [soil metagenome]
MRTIRQTTQFKRDVKRAKKRGKDFAEFKRGIALLAEGKPLEEKAP